jgi:pyruvate dehydrogenase E2 component (dihydrolipoamide acetyltransferase)
MIEFRLPSLGSDMDEGKLLEWHVRPGDAVKKGQVLAVVDTAKAAIDVECWHDGVVHALLAEPGVTMPVGTLMAVLRAPGETAQQVDEQFAASRALSPAPTPTPVVPARPAELAARPAVAAPPVAVGERAPVSPAARRRSQELGVDLATVRGSGTQGVVTLADVEAAAQRAAAAPTPAPPSALTRAQEMRKVIAAAMARSKREIPHYYLGEDIAFEHAAAWLAQRNQDLPVTQRLLPAALQLKAVALALQRYPEFSGFWKDGRFVPGTGIHIGVAISLREGGLVAPALHDVNALDIATLTRALLDLVKRTRAGALRSSELADPTITVTNLGDQGVASVFGVIYPPQVALVGFGRIGTRAWAIDTGVRAMPVVTASLAADHRASDGHRGALLLAEIRERLQAPDELDPPSPAKEP